MIICGVCGNENQEGDAFCGVCGSFLEWEGRKVGAEPEPALVTAEADEEQAGEKGLVERVVDRFTGAGEEDAGELEPAHVADAVEGLDVDVVEDEAGTEAAAALAAEAEERARLVAEAAERARDEADERARQEAAAAEAARREAEGAEQARLQAEEAAASEAAEAERLRARLEEAEAAARAREQAEADLEAEREAVQQARAEVEAAEAARLAAEERARADAEAAAAAAKEAAEADKARQAAEEKAAAEAAAAERARRAAALVAKPQPKPAQPAPKATAAATAAAGPDTKAVEPTRAPKPVKPTRTRARPTPKRQQPPSRKLRPGDLICGNCGEGNDPARNFCRRCGQSLQDATVAKTPWWRRLFGRRRKTYAAGERRGRRGREGKGAAAKGRAAKRKVLRAFATVSKLAAVLALVGVAGLSIGPWRPTVMGWAQERFTSIRQIVAPQYDPIRADSAVASSEREGHPASHAIDTLSNTWWAAAEPDGGVGATLLVTFPGAVDVAAVGITSGAADVGEFANQARPAKLHLLFDNGFDVELELADRHEFQPFKIDRDAAAGVTNVLVRVTEVYPGQAGNDLAITEIEFQTRR